MKFFECCHHCPSTKRHPGCHAKCKDYIEQNEKWLKLKETIRKESSGPPPAKTDRLNNAVWRNKKY